MTRGARPVPPDDELAGRAFVAVGEYRLHVKRADELVARTRGFDPELTAAAERVALWTRQALAAAEELFYGAAARADRPVRPVPD